MGTHELANVSLAFARFDHRHERLIAACSRAAESLKHELATQPQHACNTVLALSKLGAVAQNQDLAAALRSVLKTMGSRELTYVQQTQLF